MKLLIVDDEMLTREGLAKTIDWASLGIEACLVAPNAQSALMLHEAESPDILLCDVRMPGMSGIEMIRKIRNARSDCQVIMMSGYNDREYVMEAIDLRAVAFLDKPIRIDALTSAIAEACRRAKQEKEAKHSSVFVRLRQQEEYARHLLLGLSVDDQTAEAMAPIDSSGAFYCLILYPTQRDGQSVHSILRQSAAWHAATLDKDANEVMFAQIPNETALGELVDALASAQAGNRVAVGAPFPFPAGALESYSGAKTALATMFYRTQINVAYAAGDPEPFDLSALCEGFYSLLLLSREKALLYLDTIRDALLEHAATPIDLVKSHYHSMIEQVLHGYDECRASMLRGIEYDTLWAACKAAESFDELERLILMAFQHVENRGDGGDNAFVVQETKKYINRNCNRASLVISDIADHVHMSAGHLSVIFKEATGYTIHQFISRCRMERACLLLRQTNMRNQEIAEEIGIRNASYFSKVFSGEIGMTPQLYRKRNQ